MMFRKLMIVALSASLVAPAALAKKPETAKGPKASENSLVDVAIATRDALNADPEATFTINTIVDIVAADPVLLATLSRKGQRTVFAPTDEAFGNLVALLDTLCLTLGDLSTDEVRTVVGYHVANGRRDAEEVLGSDQIRTIIGGFLWQSMGTLTDNLGREADILFTDVFADNGVIHVIDEVVLPFAPPSACE